MTMFTETARRPLDNHFDSVQFCADYIVGLDPEIKPHNSFKHLKFFTQDHMAVAKCVLFTEIVAIPHNLYQDVKG